VEEWIDFPLPFLLSFHQQAQWKPANPLGCILKYWEMLWSYLPKIRWLVLYIAHLKLFSILYILPNPYDIFPDNTQKTK
jgi:hypothetical protein